MEYIQKIATDATTNYGTEKNAVAAKNSKLLYNQQQTRPPCTIADAAIYLPNIAAESSAANYKPGSTTTSMQLHPTNTKLITSQQQQPYYLAWVVQQMMQQQQAQQNHNPIIKQSVIFQQVPTNWFLRTNISTSQATTI